MTDTMPTLATLAVDARKPTKRAAQDLVRELYEAHPESGRELAQLYNYFTPARPKNPKTAWDWVAQAAAKDDPRYYLKFVHVTDTAIEAANGEHLHAYYTDTRADGLDAAFYTPNGDRVEADTAYPDTTRIIVEKADAEHRVPADEFEFEIRELARCNAYTITAQDGTLTGVDTHYMDRALNAGMGAPVIQRPADAKAATRVDDGNCVAIIMPIQLPD